MDNGSLITLTNEECRMTFLSFGAEWRSWISKKESRPLLWSADPLFWGKVSPILFPIVGALKDNQYLYNQQVFTLPRHGFARDKNFDVIDQSEAHVTFRLTDDAATQAIYPFSFRLLLSYQLMGNGMKCTYTVENTGTNIMPFSIGAHPAFAVPCHEDASYEEYYLQFEHQSSLLRYPLDTAGLLLKEGIRINLEEGGRLPLSKELFKDDAIVLKELHGQRIVLCHEEKGPVFRFGWDQFPYFGIWAAKDADFVCLEPWCGIADSVDADGDILRKEGIMLLAPEERISRTWWVETF